MPKGEIVVCRVDCLDQQEDVVAGSFAHELGHAYQTAFTPDDWVVNEQAGDLLPTGWGFVAEIEALKNQRRNDADQSSG